MKLTIELVPRTAWYTNVRSNVDRRTWDIIRNKSYEEAKWVCEICGDTGLNQGLKHRLECHEIWHYDDETHIQKLTGFISLCPFCHLCKHIGLAQIKGKMDIVVDHLIKVNSVTEEEIDAYYHECVKIWNKRSNYKWEIDISYIDQYLNNSNREVTEPPIF